MSIHDLATAKFKQKSVVDNVFERVLGQKSENGVFDLKFTLSEMNSMMLLRFLRSESDDQVFHFLGQVVLDLIHVVFKGEAWKIEFGYPF